MPNQMVRDNNIVLDDDEIEDLRSVRKEMFGSDEVPYGVVINSLIEDWREQ